LNGQDNSVLRTMNLGSKIFVSTPVADNGDLKLVLAAGWENTACFDNAGNLLWVNSSIRWVQGNPAVAWVDGSWRAFIPSRHENRLYAVRLSDGAVLWSFPANNPILSSVTTADLDGDGTPEVLFGTDSASAYGLPGENGALYILTANGNYFGGSQATGKFLTDGCVRSEPVIADLDWDGIPEIFLNGYLDNQIYQFRLRDPLLPPAELREVRFDVEPLLVSPEAGVVPEGEGSPVIESTPIPMEMEERPAVLREEPGLRRLKITLSFAASPAEGPTPSPPSGPSPWVPAPSPSLGPSPTSESASPPAPPKPAPPPTPRPIKLSFTDFLLPPVLSWEPCADAEYYEFELSTDPSFSSILLSLRLLATSIDLSDRGLGPGEYYCRVRSVCGGTSSEWALGTSFRIRSATAPSAPSQPPKPSSGLWVYLSIVGLLAGAGVSWFIYSRAQKPDWSKMDRVARRLEELEERLRAREAHRRLEYLHELKREIEGNELGGVEEEIRPLPGLEEELRKLRKLRRAD